MTGQEILAILNGPVDQKRQVYTDMCNRVMTGEALEDNEVSLFEALKKALTEPTKMVIGMSATLTGTGDFQ